MSMTTVLLIIQEGLSLAHTDQPVHSQVQRYPNSYIRKPSPFNVLPFQTLALARSYYSCDSIEGVYLENQGGSGTAR